jgi:surface protein
MANAFYGATNLAIKAADTPNLVNVVDMGNAFRGATNLTGNFSGWNTSNIQNMTYTFASATKFNQPLDTWDTSKVNNFSYAFNGASSFNQDLSSRSITGVTAVGNFASMLQNSALSTYNYNALLDSRSQQNPLASVTAFVATPLKYGGCETNAIAGIAGRQKLMQPLADGGKLWAISDGGLAFCQTNYPSCNTADITMGKYTISACNVGATTAGTAAASYGLLFQRGNNYGFPAAGAITPSEDLVENANDYGPTNPYSDATFRITSEYPYDWADPQNDDLWGNTGSEADRQGPCATGYHIPTNTEWLGLARATCVAGILPGVNCATDTQWGR